MTKRSMSRLEIFTKEYGQHVQEAGRVLVDIKSRALYIVPERKPCDFRTVVGSTHFDYDPQKAGADCADPELAEIFISKYKEYKDELKAADLNNIACAYLWQEEPDWKKARQLFTAAHEKDKENQTIQENKARAEKALDKPHMPSIRAADLEFLQDLRSQVGKQVEVLDSKDLREILAQWE